MALSILNNIPSLVAENQLNTTQANLQKTLYQLASGSRINSGADDAAGLAIANSLQANVTALTQSQQNANDGVGQLQVADGALSQVTTLLNRAVTLATEAASGTVNGAQRDGPEHRIHLHQKRNRQHRQRHHLQRHLGVHGFDELDLYERFEFRRRQQYHRDDDRRTVLHFDWRARTVNLWQRRPDLDRPMQPRRCTTSTPPSPP